MADGPFTEYDPDRGPTAATDGEAVTIERDQASYGDEPVVTVPWDAIAEARLILTDDLISEALRKDKLARQAMKKHDGDDEDAPQDEEDNES